MNDPISDSKSFLAMLAEQCRGITTKKIEAGNYKEIVLLMVNIVSQF